MPRHPGRSGHAWRQVRAAVLATSDICWLCGKPGANSVDHIISLKAMRSLPPAEQRSLALNPANLRPAHFRCNSARGARTAVPQGTPSRVW